jgi:hypothetical protein
VQARVDIKVLAELDVYWEDTGIVIRSMSQLVSWSMSLLHDIMDKNDMLKVRFEEVAECNRRLEQRCLYQRSMKNRAIRKIGTAQKFESLRLEGVEPSSYVSNEYGMVHNNRSVEPYQSKGRGKGVEIDGRYYTAEELKEFERRGREERIEREGREAKERISRSATPAKKNCVDIDAQLARAEEVDRKLEEM